MKTIVKGLSYTISIIRAPAKIINCNRLIITYILIFAATNHKSIHFKSGS